MDQDDQTSETRAARGRERRAKRGRLAAIIGGVVLAVAVVGTAVAVVVGWRVPLPLVAGSSSAEPPLAAATTSRTVSQAVAAGQVEIPNVVGMPLSQARTLLEAAHVSVHLSVVTTAAPSAGQDVQDQSPGAGVVVATGSAVSIRVAPGGKGSAPAHPDSRGGFVVVIDPGHQSKPDPNPEPIGPGSQVTQAKSTAGSTGAATGIPEYELDLEIASNLKDRLQTAGIKVVMTRTTNDVDISNAQRAQIANKAKAALFVRIHADNEVDPNLTGVETLYPASDQWTKSFSATSKKAAELVQDAVVAATGAKDNGEFARDNQAGFNWATVPCISVNVGNPGNSVEDKLLTSPHYQDRVAQGIADGVLDFSGKGQ